MSTQSFHVSVIVKYDTMQLETIKIVGGMKSETKSLFNIFDTQTCERVYGKVL